MKFESKPAANLLLYIVIIIVGVTLMVLAGDFRNGGSNVLCGFILGCLLSGLGIIGLVIGESRSVELDVRRKRIVLDIRRRVGGSRQIIIPFADIRKFGIGLQGRASAGTRYYDVVVNLYSGAEISLFGGCVFDGRMSRDWIEGIKRNFEQALDTSKNSNVDAQENQT
jgi:hypothetical protein